MPMTPHDPTVSGSSPSASSVSAALSADRLFHVLQNERRRLVLSYLLDNTGRVDVPALVEHVGKREEGTDVDGETLSSNQRLRISTDLYQSQLPKLDQEGLVEYDQQGETVEPADDLEAVEAHLPGEPADTADPPGYLAGASWLQYYTGVTAISALLVAVAVFGPVASISFSFRLVAAMVTGLLALVTTTMFLDGAA